MFLIFLKIEKERKISYDYTTMLKSKKYTYLLIILINLLIFTIIKLFKIFAYSFVISNFTTRNKL